MHRKNNAPELLKEARECLMYGMPLPCPKTEALRIQDYILGLPESILVFMGDIVVPPTF